VDLLLAEQQQLTAVRSLRAAPCRYARAAPGALVPRPGPRGAAGRGPAVCVPRRPRSVHGLQGVRHRVPQPERARRRRTWRDVGLLIGERRRRLRCRPSPRRATTAKTRRASRAARSRVREGPGRPGSSPPRRPVHRLSVLRAHVPVRRAQVRRARGIVRKCDMCSDRLPQARRPRACRAARHRRSRSTWSRSVARGAAAAGGGARDARPCVHTADHALRGRAPARRAAVRERAHARAGRSRTTRSR
jgi:hypothetical protein